MPGPTDEHIKAAKRAASMPKPETTSPVAKQRGKATRHILISAASELLIIWIVGFHSDLPAWAKVLLITLYALMLVLVTVFWPKARKLGARRDALAREQVYRVRQLDPETDPAGFGLGNLCDALSGVNEATGGGKLTTEEIELVRAGAVFAVEQVRTTLADVAATGVPEPTLKGQRWDDTAGDDGRGGFVKAARPDPDVARTAARIRSGFGMDSDQLLRDVRQYGGKPEAGQTFSKPGICFCDDRNGANGHRHRYREVCLCLATNKPGQGHQHVYVARDGDSI